MFFRQRTLFQTTRCLLLISLLCCAFLFGLQPFSADASFFFTEEVRGTLSVMTCIWSIYEVSNALSPINGWETEVRDLSEREDIIKGQMTGAPTTEIFADYQSQLLDVQKEKRERKKKLTRFKTWFYPAVGVVTTGIFILGVWLSGGPSS